MTLIIYKLLNLLIFNFINVRLNAMDGCVFFPAGTPLDFVAQNGNQIVRTNHESAVAAYAVHVASLVVLHFNACFKSVI